MEKHIIEQLKEEIKERLCVEMNFNGLKFSTMNIILDSIDKVFDEILTER